MVGGKWYSSCPPVLSVNRATASGGRTTYRQHSGPNQGPRGLAGRYSTGYSHQNVLLRFGINVVRHIEITG
jgi:hypothetical protein